MKFVLMLFVSMFVLIVFVLTAFVLMAIALWLSQKTHFLYFFNVICLLPMFSAIIIYSDNNSLGEICPF
jgi:hypothetical protein